MPDIEKQIVVPVTAETAQLDKKVKDGIKKAEQNKIVVGTDVDLKGIENAIKEMNGLTETLRKAFAKVGKDDFQFGNIIKSIEKVEGKFDNLTSTIGELDSLINHTEKGGDFLKVTVGNLGKVNQAADALYESLIKIDEVEGKQTKTNKFDTLLKTLQDIKGATEQIVSGFDLGKVAPLSKITENIELTKKELEDTIQVTDKAQSKFEKLESVLTKGATQKKAMDVINEQSSDDVIISQKALDSLNEYIRLGADLSKLPLANGKTMLDFANVLKNEGVLDATAEKILDLTETLSKLDIERQRAEKRQKGIEINFNQETLDKFAVSMVKMSEQMSQSVGDGMLLGMKPEDLQKIVDGINEITNAVKTVADILSNGIEISKINSAVETVKSNAEEAANATEKLGDDTSAVDKKADAVNNLADAMERVSGASHETALSSPAIDESAVSSVEKQAETQSDVTSIVSKTNEEYERGISLLREYVELVDKIQLGNKNILPIKGERTSFLVNDTDTTKNSNYRSVTQTSVKRELETLLRNIRHSQDESYSNESREVFKESIELSKDKLAAYVNALNNSEQAIKIFGKTNSELYKEITERIENAKIATEAFETAQAKLSGAKYSFKNIAGENGELKNDKQLKELLANKDLQGAIDLLIDKYKIKLPQAVETAKDAMANIKPNETTISTPEIKAETQAIEEQTDALNANAVAQERANDAEKGNPNDPASTTAEEMQKELGIVKEFVAQERQELDKLRSTIDTDIVQAIRKKDDEFLAEKKVVERVVASEIFNLNELIQKIEKVIQSVKELSNIPVKLDINAQDLNDFDPNKLESINKLKESVSNIHTDDLQKLSDALKEVGKANISKNIDKLATSLQNLKEGLNKIDNDGTSFLGDIKEILAKSKDLENLANVLKESKKKIKEVKVSVKNDNSQDIVNEENFKNAENAIDSFYSSLKGALKGNDFNLSDLDNQLKSINVNINSIDASKLDLSSIRKTLSEFGGNVDLRNVTDDFRNRFIAAREELLKCASIFEKIEAGQPISDEDIAKIKVAVTEMAKINSDKGKSYSKAPNENTYAKLLANMEQYKLKITGASKETREELDRMIEHLMKFGMTGSQADLTQLGTEFAAFQARVRAAGEEVDSFFKILKNDILKKSIATFAQYFSLFDVIQYGRQAFTISKDYDTALTEMRKVSDESVESLKKYQEETFDISDNIGAVAKNLQNSTADFQRLGHNLETASKLAQHATIYSNVGDMDINTATEHMVSSVQAWKSEFANEVEASEAIINKYNEIGNNFAISSAEIGEAMERSAAALKAGGNSLDESLGLITAGNIIQQDAETTAAAIKILSMRVRGSKIELQEMGEEIDGVAETSSKMREQIKAISGVDIMLNEDTYKSTAQQIRELGSAYKEMTDVEQAALLELIAGKNRASTIAGLLENYEIIDEVIKSAENAGDSAFEENQKIIESLTGSTQRFTNQLHDLATTVADSDFLIGLVDTGTGLLDILNQLIDKIGVLSTAGIGLGAVLGAKNVGRAKCSPSQHRILFTHMPTLI